MGKLKFQISVSLDGFIAGPNPSEEHPLGEGGEQLHEWVLELAAWRRPHGREGGEINASTPVFEAATASVGATIMGRNMFGGGPGPWGEDPWRGWWGEEPPFHHPVFVLTHHERETLELSGGNSFTFVTGGIESALDQAREAAGDGDVAIGGGADVIQQYLFAGLVDEMLLNVVPVLLGSGARLFDNLAAAELGLEQVQVVEAPDVAHLIYRAFLDLDPGSLRAEVANRRAADLALATPGLVDVAADRQPRCLRFDRLQQRWAAEVIARAVGVAVALRGRVEDEHRILRAGCEHRGGRLIIEIKAPVPWRNRDAGAETVELNAIDLRAGAVQDGGGAPVGGRLAQCGLGLVVAGDQQGRRLDRRQGVDRLAQPLVHRGEVAGADHHVGFG